MGDIIAITAITVTIGTLAVIWIRTERAHSQSRREADEALIISMLHI